MALINTPILLEIILTTEIKLEPQPYLEEKDRIPRILKDDFFSRTDPSIFASTAPVMLDGSNNKLDELRNEQIKTKTSIKLNARIIINPCHSTSNIFCKNCFSTTGHQERTSVF